MVSEVLGYVALSLLVALGGLLTATYKRQKAQAKGIQALLRDRLYEIYFRCMSKGYATNVEKNNFENLYVQYHALGRNGVMDAYRKQLLELPTKIERKRKYVDAKSV